MARYALSPLSATIVRNSATPASSPHLKHYLLLFALTALLIALPAPVFAQTTPNPDTPYISEVAPTAGEGAAAWVEVTMGRTTSGSVQQPGDGRVFLPVIGNSSLQQVVSTQTQMAQTEVAQVFPDTGNNLHGWHLSDMDGNTFDVPLNLPFLEKGTIVVVIFDGLGAAANDMDPGDGRITLHTPAGMTDIFDATGDQLALTDPGGNLVSFVAWGTDAGDDDDAAAAAGVWSNGTFVVYDSGFGSGQVNVPPVANASIGIWQNEPTANPHNWVAYAASNSTPGALNPPPAPLHSTVPNGTTVVINGPTPQSPVAAAEGGSTQVRTLLPANEIGIAWSGMGADFNYQFELAASDNFAAPVVDMLMADPGWSGEVAEGTWYWRARVVDKKGNYSQYLGPYQINVSNGVNFQSLGTMKMLLDTDEYKIQHKDSTMLDIGGGPNNVVGAGNPGNRRYPLDSRWDGEHVDAGGNPRFAWNGMDNIYCVRASSAMLNDYYGGNITQDRISYYAFEELTDDWYGTTAALRGVPENDLGFGTGIGDYAIQDKVVSWVLGGAAVSSALYCPNPGIADYTCPNPAGDPMTFDDVKSLIDAGKPFVSVNLNNAHARVVDGYWELSDTQQYVHLIDPVPANTSTCPTCTNAAWITYDTFTNNHERAIWATGSVSNARKLEPSLLLDNDHDGINNFDETMRFDTNPNKADTDGDLVKDKNDLAEYIFIANTEGTYNYTPGILPKTSDFDGDGKRKELDADNDNDGSLDGCEDADLDGEQDGVPLETSNFNAALGTVCQPTFAIVHPRTAQAANAGDPANPDKVLIQIDLTFPPAVSPAPLFATSQFSASIGGKPATIINGLRTGQQYWLLVQAPVQDSQSVFDLKVDFDGTPTGHDDQTDTEVNAVYYVPRPRADAVVVFDRSGSMSDAGKLDSAKNAARLYIDQWAENDRIALVTFGDTATVDKAMTTIGADWQALTDTKTLLNGVPASGQTAMGPGLLAGQNQLETSGDPAHTWTMVLLTDGQENVDPQWSDASVSDVIIASQTVVDTVGVGEPLSEYFTTLAAIAGSTGGRYTALDDPGAMSAADGGAEVDEVAEAAEVNATTFATQLSNQLADAYKYSAEGTLGEERIYAATGNVTANTASGTPNPVSHRFYVDDDVPSLLIVGNFDRPGSGRIRVFDPTGTEINMLLPAVQHRFDATHDQVRIPEPMPGLWHVQVMLRNGQVQPTEYALFASADTPLTLNLVADDPQQANAVTGAGLLLPVAAFLADDAMITSGASVVLDVKTPDGGSSTIQMVDDGAHGDGAANDGIWGVSIMLTRNGPYQLVAKATLSTPGATYRYDKLTVNY